METSDVNLIEQTLNGDTNAFGTLVKKYQSAVYGLVFHITGSFSDAEDLAQESFIKAYENLNTLRERNRFASWLKTIATNVCNDWLRRQSARNSFAEAKGEQYVAESMTKSAPMPDEEIETQELRRVVLDSINRLPQKHRLVVTLHYKASLPVAQEAP